MKTIIHVDQHAIRRNIRADDPEPVLSCKTYKGNAKAFEVTIDGPCRIVYRPHKPLSCGARVWIETKASVQTVESVTSVTVEESA